MKYQFNERREASVHTYDKIASLALMVFCKIYLFIYFLSIKHYLSCAPEKNPSNAAAIYIHSKINIDIGGVDKLHVVNSTRKTNAKKVLRTSLLDNRTRQRLC